MVSGTSVSPSWKQLLLMESSGAIDMLVLSIFRTILRTSVEFVNDDVVLDLRLWEGK